jgi:uncharacterized protein (DUF2249 family)
MEEALITRHTRLSHLFRHYPALLEVMMAQSPHFERLRNPLLRRALTPVTSIEQAARIAGLDIEQLVETLCRAVGQRSPVDEPGELLELSDGDRPGWLGAPLAAVLDVREQQQRGEPVLRPILDLARTVPLGSQWVLLNTFDPLPLYAVLRKQGFVGWTTQRGEDDWEIHFFRQGEGETSAAPISVQSEEPRAASATLDVRHLPPPEPMQQILAILSTLEPEQWLYVHHARRPEYLLPLLREQGHEYDCAARADGTVDFWVKKGRAP